MTIKVTNNFDIELVENLIRAKIELFGGIQAKKMERYAKKEAIWLNHTTNARNSILGEFKWRGDEAVINLSSNMEYSSFLELANEKKYAIIYPTILRRTAVIMKGYQKVVREG